MSNLRKLILVDSFAASRIRELRLDGHVHVSGRNGRGKTTLIRLIPLFYGEQTPLPAGGERPESQL